MTQNFEFSKMKFFVTPTRGKVMSFCDAGGCDAASDCDGGSNCDENA